MDEFIMDRTSNECGRQTKVEKDRSWGGQPLQREQLKRRQDKTTVKISNWDHIAVSTND